MHRRPLPAFATALALAAVVLAGCAAEDPYDPNADVEETGRTVELNISVNDLYETPLYPGLNANLWAFCVTPFNPADSYSRDAIQYWDPIDYEFEVRDTAGSVLATASESESGTTSWGGEKKASRPECSVPAPTIVVEQGDRVVVHFSHTHIHPHTIHWHGQYVPTDMDGAPGLSQSSVKSGEAFTYEFIAKRAGTLWYHCHVDTQVHQMQGLHGLFIVKPKDDRFEPDVDDEAYMVLSTAKRSFVEAIPGSPPHSHKQGAISGTPGEQNPPEDLEPDVFLINGHSYPLTHLQKQTMYHIGEGERLRLRILNAGSTVEAIHPHGHDMLVTHRDGVPLASPFWVDTLSIGPAERYDVVIEGNNPGAWMIHTHVNDHETNDKQAPGGMHTMLMYPGFEDQCKECQSELAGGFPYQRPVFMPADFVNSTPIQLNPNAGTGGVPSGNVAAHAEWRSPRVDLPCAGQSLTVDASLDGSAIATAISSVTVTLVDPDGTEKGSFVLGRGGAPTGSIRINGSEPGSDIPQLVKGWYKVLLDGQAAQVTVHLKAQVDYFSSFEEMHRLHQIDKVQYPLQCGKYGNGTDGATLD